MSISNVKVDDVVSFTYFATVDDVYRKEGELCLKLFDIDRKNEFHVMGSKLVETGESADEYHETKSTTKVKVAEMLVNLYGVPFTVCFVKANGQTRTIRCRLIKPEPLLGRSMVEDLDVSNKKERIKQVDHRTIKYLIANGVKYVVKK